MYLSLQRVKQILYRYSFSTKAMSKLMATAMAIAKGVAMGFLYFNTCSCNDQAAATNSDMAFNDNNLLVALTAYQ